MSEQNSEFIAGILASRGAEEFLDNILGAIWQDFHVIQSDNFDRERFPDLDPDRVDYRKHIFYLKWLHRNYELLFQAFSLLEDDQSRYLFQELIRYRIAGHRHVRLQSNTPFHWQARERAKKINCEPAPFFYPGQFGAPTLCTFPWLGKEVNLYAYQLGLAWYLLYRQYHFNRDGIEIGASRGDTVIDGGACLGDTSVLFSLEVGEKGRVYCFDCVQEHLEIIEANKNINRIENLEIIAAGLSDHQTRGEPVSIGTIWPGHRLDQGNTALPLESIDCFIQDMGIERVDFIKLDIEGSEMDCLKGARKTLDRDAPKLAVSLYHNPDDLYLIPLWLKQNLPEYSFFLEHYTIHDEETILYGMPASRRRG